MGEVIGIKHGSAIASPGSPDPAVVSLLDDMLTRAKAGEISGVAIAADYADNATGGFHAGTYSRGMVGRLFAWATSISIRLDQI